MYSCDQNSTACSSCEVKCNLRLFVSFLKALSDCVSLFSYYLSLVLSEVFNGEAMRPDMEYTKTYFSQFSFGKFFLKFIVWFMWSTLKYIKFLRLRIQEISMLRMFPDTKCKPENKINKNLRNFFLTSLFLLLLLLYS